MSLIFLRGQVAHMKQRGFDVHAVSSPGSELQEFGRAEAVDVSAVPMERRVALFRDLVSLARILRVIHVNRPIIVHAHTPKAGLLGMIAARLAGVPVRIYHMRGLPLLGAKGLRRWLLWCSEWVACRLADQVLCVSHSVREEAARFRICSPDRLRVLGGGSGNGVDAVDRFNPDKVGKEARVLTRKRLSIPTDALVIGFVGRIVRDKGIEELIEAWQHVRDRVPSARLVLVGPVEAQDPLSRSSYARLHSDNRIHVVGADWNTPPLYAAMDVVVLPTYREGFPNVPLEAAAMELPVVATRVPGCVDAVEDAITGTLVPVRDAAALEAALHAYLSDEALRRKHGRNGRHRVLRDFRQETIWAAIHSEYLRLLKSSVSPPQPDGDAIHAPHELVPEGD